MTLRVLVAIAVSMLASTPRSEAASCSADATMANSWEERGGWKLNAKFRVQPEGCGGYCNGHVQFRIHYSRNDDGWSNTCSGITSWSLDTDRSSTAEAKGDCIASVCSDRGGKECTINDVEITKVSCYD